jgi:hypothetical protein
MRPLALAVVLGAALAGVAVAAPLSARVEVRNGRPTLLVDGAPEVPMLYALTDVPGGRFSWEDVPARNVREFARTAGVRLFQLDVAMEHVFLEDGKVDLTVARRQIQGVLAARADAGVVFRLHVRPPRWWLARHPEELTVFLDTAMQPEHVAGHNRFIEDDLKPVPRVSLASTRWLREMGDVVARFCGGLAATPEGEALVGIQVASGVYGEWHYWAFTDHEVDAGPAMTAAFRRWLQGRYGNDEALRAAWADPAASLASAEVPGLAARRGTRDGSFRDPATEQRVIDYYRCQHEVVADAILRFCRIVKESWPRPLVTGAFYGYFFSCFGRDQAGGHLEPERVLRSPFVDYLSAPSAYYPESVEVGDPYRSRGLVASARAHGKLWLDEMDQAVPLKPYADPEYPRSLAESIAKVRRNVMFGQANGSGLWFYDFGPSGFSQGPAQSRTNALGVNGWWDDPALLADIGRLRVFLRSRLDRPWRTASDTLAVFDTQSYYHTRSVKEAPDAISHALVNWGTLGLYRAGIAFDSLDLQDLPDVDLSPYKVVVFFNTWRLSAGERRLIRARVATGGRHVVWFYAPGYTDGTRNSDGFVRETTGLDLRRVEVPGKATIETTPALGDRLEYSLVDTTVSPLYALHDGDATVLGRFASTGDVAIASRRFADHTAWYAALPAWSSEIFRRLFAQTAAHRYSEEGDVVYAGGGLVTLHTKVGGRRTVALRDGRRVALDLPDGPSTVVLDAGTGRQVCCDERAAQSRTSTVRGPARDRGKSA